MTNQQKNECAFDTTQYFQRLSFEDNFWVIEVRRTVVALAQLQFAGNFGGIPALIAVFNWNPSCFCIIMKIARLVVTIDNHKMFTDYARIIKIGICIIYLFSNVTCAPKGHH